MGHRARRRGLSSACPRGGLYSDLCPALLRSVKITWVGQHLVVQMWRKASLGVAPRAPCTASILGVPKLAAVWGSEPLQARRAGLARGGLHRWAKGRECGGGWAPTSALWRFFSSHQKVETCQCCDQLKCES